MEACKQTNRRTSAGSQSSFGKTSLMYFVTMLRTTRVDATPGLSQEGQRDGSEKLSQA